MCLFYTDPWVRRGICNSNQPPSWTFVPLLHWRYRCAHTHTHIHIHVGNSSLSWILAPSPLLSFCSFHSLLIQTLLYLPFFPVPNIFFPQCVGECNAFVSFAGSFFQHCFKMMSLFFNMKFLKIFRFTCDRLIASRSRVC